MERVYVKYLVCVPNGEKEPMLCKHSGNLISAMFVYMKTPKASLWKHTISDRKTYTMIKSKGGKR